MGLLSRHSGGVLVDSSQELLTERIRSHVLISYLGFLFVLTFDLAMH